MIKAVGKSLAFMTRGERIRWYSLTSLRALLSILDLAGVMAIGFVVTSTALFLTNGSDPNRVLEFAGLSLTAANARSLPLFAIAILVLFLTKALLSIWLTKKAAFFVATIEARAAKKIAETLFSSDLEVAREKSREEMMYAIQESSPSAFNRLLNLTGTLVAEGSLFLLIAIGFLFIDPVATVAAIAYFCLVGILLQLFIGSLMRRSGEQLAAGSVMANTALSDLISVFRELTVLGKRQEFIDKVYKARVSATQANANHFYLSGMPRYVIETALLVGVALFILSQALTGDLVGSAATIGVFLSGGFRLTASMLPLQNALLVMRSEISIASRAHEILSMSTSKSGPNEKNQKPGAPISVSESPVGFEAVNLSFKYAGAQSNALESISLRVQAGQVVAFIGESGAGKSTMADLLCGVLTPTKGSIKLRKDGGELEGSSRGLISYVPQKPGLVSGTIAANVALAVDDSEIDRSRVLSALKLAHMEKVISELPEGIDTELGKMQDSLSGGQTQRLGLARALYTKPSLLVMDEATSALDAESEAEIHKALNEMRGKVTVVLIAHRLNTVQRCDNVFFLKEGKLDDEGTFQELLARNATVQKLVDLMRLEGNEKSRA